MAPMTDEQVQNNLKDVEGWSFANGHLTRTYTFGNYYETMAFLNALAWIAHREDHHPDIEVGYKTCVVTVLHPFDWRYFGQRLLSALRKSTRCCKQLQYETRHFQKIGAFVVCHGVELPS